jgi:hypothetical protein
MNVKKKNIVKLSTFNSKGEYNSAESLFMALILQQQKMISNLIDKVSKYQVNQKNNYMIYYHLCSYYFCFTCFIDFQLFTQIILPGASKFPPANQYLVLLLKC